MWVELESFIVWGKKRNLKISYCMVEDTRTGNAQFDIYSEDVNSAIEEEPISIIFSSNSMRLTGNLFKQLKAVNEYLEMSPSKRKKT